MTMNFAKNRVDDIDTMILALLLKQPQPSVRDIGKAVGLSSTSVHYRIKHLIELECVVSTEIGKAKSKVVTSKGKAFVPKGDRIWN